jgi:hypothetical protein
MVADGANASTLSGDTFNRPIFTADREFVFEAPQGVTEIQDSSLPITIRVFADAASSCHLNLDRLHEQFSQVLNSASIVWQALDLLFPGSLSTVRTKGITLLIDDFSEFAGNNPEYASYFVHDNDGPVIGLDCSSTLARSYWIPSLTHELTHAILDGQGDESWWEEALAQQMEHYAGGEQPDLSARDLARDAQASGLPQLVDARRPIPSHVEYGISYLFSKYILQEFGGWPTLQAMATPTLKTNDFLAQIAAQAQAKMESPGEKNSAAFFGSSLSAEKLTPSGLLRFFYVALTLNDSSYSEYSIGGWQGLDGIAKEPSSQILQPGQAAVFQDVAKLSSINPSLESYRVVVDANNVFAILPSTAAANGPSGFHASRDYALVLNLTDIAQLTFKR